MADNHQHDHHHGGHSHGVSADADRRKLTIALMLILGLMVAEIAAGVIANSLALLSDAGHMLTDAIALGLALVASRLALRPAQGSMTYGYKRAEILSAQVNGVTLLILGIFIVFEGIGRLFSPPDVDATLVLVIALVGIVVNLAATLVLAQANRESLNIEGSFQHLLTDLYAFAGTAVAAIVIIFTGFNQADPIASLVVAFMMLRSAYRLLRESGRIFLEASPRGIDPDEIGQALAKQKGIVEVHDLHVWEVTSGFPALSAHILVRDDIDCHAARRRLEALIHDNFKISHTTLQVDHEGGDLLAIEDRVRSK
jgi:cobalt-zinc-cadmium efflux system protein